MPALFLSCATQVGDRGAPPSSHTTICTVPVYGDFLALLVTSVPVVLEAPSLTLRILFVISGFRLSISTSAKDAQNFGCVAQTDSALHRLVRPTTRASADFFMPFRQRLRYRSQFCSPKWETDMKTSPDNARRLYTYAFRDAPRALPGALIQKKKAGFLPPFL